MGRGRILQVLRQASGAQGDSQLADQIEPQRSTVIEDEPVRVSRGRGGRILNQLASLSIRSTTIPQSAEVETDIRPASPLNEDRANGSQRSRHDSSSSNASVPIVQQRLSRQGSDVSRTSVLSHQFANVEQIETKAGLPKQPSTSGTAIKLSLNYMTFLTQDCTRVEEYHVEFRPDIESIRLRYSILRSPEAQEVIGSVMHWNGTNLYLPKRLASNQSTFEVNHPVSGSTVKVRLVFVKTPPDSELLPFYNSLMHKVMNRLNYVIFNRTHFSPLHKISIEQHRLEVWPGWVTSIQRLDGGMKLVIDSSFRVLRLETVRDIMVDIKNRSRGGSLKESFEQELVGSIVMTRYNNKAYRIDELDLAKKPTDTFPMRDGREISYVDYMRENWNVEVRDLHQPMIVHRPRPKRGQEQSDVCYLIPELCVTTGLTDELRANFTVMKAIGDHTRLPPDVRESKLNEFLQQITTDERAKSVFSDWNLAVQPALDIVNARRLETETILFGADRQSKVLDNADWTRPATNGAVFKTVDIENWVLMYTERDAPIANDLMASIREVSRALNIKFCKPRIVTLPNDTPATYINAGKREVKQSDQMVVIMTPGKGQREDRYSACKRLYSCDLPVPCQFIRCGTVSNPRKIRSICQKIVIQILSKVGGQPWAMKLPIKSFMIVGIDVYHDTIDRKKSCLGFVASMNETCSSWWSHTFFQNSLEEIGQKINVTMVNALRKYHASNGRMPQKIIVYRDGVGDGQLEATLNTEVVQALSGVKFYMRDDPSNESEPHFSYIVVQKRINTKLSLRDSGRVVNPLPGSYLDHTVTHPQYNDFYLVSQHVNQGTVSPTHYIVLAETGNLKMDHHQKLAYKMTHMYYNWCGTIRVPAPCQYAHKLAYLTGENIRQQASERLEDKLYYL